jgi:hypothetical protein
MTVPSFQGVHMRNGLLGITVAILILPGAGSAEAQEVRKIQDHSFLLEEA